MYEEIMKTRFTAEEQSYLRGLSKQDSVDVSDEPEADELDDKFVRAEQDWN